MASTPQRIRFLKIDGCSRCSNLCNNTLNYFKWCKQSTSKFLRHLMYLIVASNIKQAIVIGHQLVVALPPAASNFSCDPSYTLLLHQICYMLSSASKSVFLTAIFLASNFKYFLSASVSLHLKRQAG